MAYANDSQIYDTLLKIDDFSDRINIGLNSYPGINEKLINEWVKKNSPKKAFFLKVQYGNEVASTSSGKIIYGADIYIVNPSKKTGFLLWEKVKFHILKEPDWTLFRLESKPLNAEDLEKLRLLLR